MSGFTSSVVDYKSSVVYIQKDGYVFRLKPETQVGQPLYDALTTPVMDLRFSNSKTGDACWPIYAEQFMTNVWGEKKGVDQYYSRGPCLSFN